MQIIKNRLTGRDNHYNTETVLPNSFSNLDNFPKPIDLFLYLIISRVRLSIISQFPTSLDL
jgi:hypothetical protein